MQQNQIRLSYITHNASAAALGDEEELQRSAQLTVVLLHAALERTAKTTAAGQLAGTLCTCTRGNTCPTCRERRLCSSFKKGNQKTHGY